MKRLLIVDDENSILRSLKRMLAGRMQVLTTTSPIAAAKAVEANASFFDALLTDFHMPKMSGVELALIARDAGVPEVIIMTGAPDEPGLQHCGFEVLDKPVGAKTLERLLGLQS